MTCTANGVRAPGAGIIEDTLERGVVGDAFVDIATAGMLPIGSSGSREMRTVDERVPCFSRAYRERFGATTR